MTGWTKGFARALAVVHALAGLAVAGGAAWIVFQPWQRPDLLAASALPLAAALAIAAWLVVLAFRLWRLAPGWEVPLRRTLSSRS